MSLTSYLCSTPRFRFASAKILLLCNPDKSFSVILCLIHIFCTFVTLFEAMENPKTRLQFIAAAKELFVKKGYDETTMIDIAEEAGLSRRTLYAYFESKVEVFQAVINSEVEKVLNQLTDIARQNMPVQQKIVEFVFG